MKRTLPALASLLLPVLLLANGCASPAQSGLDAYRAGDSAGALEQWLPRAYAGSAEAQYLVGLMYEEGQGTAVDEPQAALWYRLAAEQGHPAAQNNLGLMYFQGRGVAKSASEAANWYALAAEQGFSVAQNNLGVQYLLGLGVESDGLRARSLLRRAAEQGNRKAQRTLATVYYAGIGVEPDRAQAEEWFERAKDGAGPGNELSQAAFDSCLELLDRKIAAAD